MCSFCGYEDSKVLDSRPVEEGKCIRRRRECLSCGRRFTTYERMEEVPLIVVKRDNRREVFDSNKILKRGHQSPATSARCRLPC